MKKKEENKYVNTIWMQMSQSLKHFSSSQDQEDLHQFRVQVKRLKSVLALFSNSSDHSKIKKHVKPIREIFKEAGYIRETFLLQAMSSQYGLNAAHSSDDGKLLQHSIEQFCSKTDKFERKINRSRHELKKVIHQVSASKISLFYKNELEQVLLVLAKQEFSEDLHQARMQIKNLINNRKLAENTLGKKLKLNFNYLNNLQEIIGQWHDVQIAMEMLNHKIQKSAFAKLTRQNSRLEKIILEKSYGFWQKTTKGSRAA